MEYVKLAGLTVLLLTALTGVFAILLKVYDYFLIKKDAYVRKRIGSFTSLEMWSNAVKSKCMEWVAKTPRVQVSDNMNLVLLEKLSGRYSKNEIQAWQRGGLLLGLGLYYENNTCEHNVRLMLENSLTSLFDEKHIWKEKPGYIDYALLAYAVMKLPIYTDLYKRAMDMVVSVIREHVGEDGTVFYRKDISNYRLVDTVGMICPFLIRFGYKYKRPELIDLALKQIENFTRYGVHPVSYIPAHAYHVKSRMPLGIYGWGRGTGWYALGLMDSYEELQQGNPGKERLGKSIIMLAESVVKYQRPDGGWGHSILLDHNVYDSSATAVLLYFLKKAALHGLAASECCKKAIERAELKLRLSSRTDGTIDYSQGDTKGIGNYSAVFRELPFTQGIALAALNIKRQEAVV